MHKMVQTLPRGARRQRVESWIKFGECECAPHQLVKDCGALPRRIQRIECSHPWACAVQLSPMGQVDLLDAALDTDLNLTEAEKVEILRSACAELSALEEASLVHGDVKPENIVVACEPGTSRPTRGHIVDFGNVHSIGAEWWPWRETEKYRLPAARYGDAATSEIDAWGLAMTAAAVLLVESVPKGNAETRMRWASRAPLARRLLEEKSPSSQLRVFPQPPSAPSKS